MLMNCTVKAALTAVALLAVSRSAAAQYHEGSVINGGSVSGSVRVVGDVPTLPPQPVFKEHEVCGDTMPDERLLVGANGALRNAVVSLVNVPSGKPLPRSQPIVLDNLKCAFVPHVSTASVGQTLEVHNSDPFLHDAHALLGSRTLFNVAIPKGRTVRRELTEPGLVYLNCNIRHTWMHAYLFVSEHPYHTVSGDGGRFQLTDVPPGKYTLRVWHEMLGSVDREITVEPGKDTVANFELRAAAPETP